MAQKVSETLQTGTDKPETAHWGTRETHREAGEMLTGYGSGIITPGKEGYIWS